MELSSNGASSVNDLDVNNPIVFKSDSRFTSMSYAGGTEILDRSIRISDAVKKKLQKIDGKFTIGSTFKNLHLYSSQAEVLDGRSRVCYIVGNEDELIISEFHNPRGDKYSALYPILVDVLHEEGFKSHKGSCKEVKFIVHFAEVDLFVEACNKVIQLHLNDLLELRVSNEFYTINRKDEHGVKHDEYFFKTFYTYKDNQTAANPYKMIAKEVVIATTAEQLSSISDKLTTIKTLLDNKRLELETIENI